jgi:hypothetical protein
VLKGAAAVKSVCEVVKLLKVFAEETKNFEGEVNKSVCGFWSMFENVVVFEDK